MGVFDPSSYIDGFRARAARRAEERAKHAHAVRGKLAEVVRVLRGFGATRIVLFGSLARGTMREDSDVDLLVDGVPTAKLIDATVAVERVLGDLHADIVPRATARPEIIARADQEGEALYG